MARRSGILRTLVQAQREAERHDKAMQEGQHRLLVVDQAVKQVACGALFGASFS